MKGDFSRISFDPAKHFSGVQLQQGRVTLDADWNEQGAILLHTLRMLARDLIGPCGGPADALGFQLSLDNPIVGRSALTIGAGRYYVDGVLVENDSACVYASQPERTPAADDALLSLLKVGGNDDVWLYLDVWERHVSWLEDDSIREPALGAVDTCSRSKVSWQVRSLTRGAVLGSLKAKKEAVDQRIADPKNAWPPGGLAAAQKRSQALGDAITGLSPDATGQTFADCHAPLAGLDADSDAFMAARLDPGQQLKDPCVIAPDAQYRGVENQLYRVEVHRGSAPGVAPTIKWSRDNGSVATRWTGTEGNDLIAAGSRGFSAGCWVELGDASNLLTGTPGLLVRLAKVDGDRLSVDPTSIAAGRSIAWTNDLVSPTLRRWDQTESDDVTLVDGALPLPADGGGPWIDLEDGIQVQFSAPANLRSGDYWLIPARVAGGSIEWPHRLDSSGSTLWQPQPPRGVTHHYASLGFVGLKAGELAITPCLCTITPIGDCSAAERRVVVGPAPPPPAPSPVKPVRPVKPAAPKPPATPQ